MIIDTHQHAWQLDRFDYGWLRPDMPALYRNFMPDEAIPQMQTAGVDACILVEANGSWPEIPWLLELADHHDHIAGVVGGPALLTPNAHGHLAQQAQHAAFKGIRIGWFGPHDDATAITRALVICADLDLTCDLLLNPAAYPKSMSCSPNIQRCVLCWITSREYVSRPTRERRGQRHCLRSRSIRTRLSRYPAT